MEFLNFLLLLVVVSTVFGIKSRIKEIEDKLNGGTKEVVEAPKPAHQPHVAIAEQKHVEQPVVRPQAQQVVQPAPVRQAQEPAGPDIVQRFVIWFVHDWPLKIGALLFLAGFGWFASYAFMQEWIGPVGITFSGLVAGTAVMLFGYWRISGDKTQGIFLHLLGATMISIVVYAARVVNIFPEEVAMVLLLATSATIASASAVFAVRRLAVIGLLLAGAVPFLVHAASSNVLYLFAYIFGVTCVYLLLSWWQKNMELTVTAFVMQGVFSVLALVGVLSGDQSALVIFAYMFGVVFLIASTVGLQRTQGDEVQPYIFIACLNALLLAFWIYDGVSHDAQGLVYLAWSFVYAYIGFIVTRLRGVAAPFYVNALLASVFLVLATMMQFDGVLLHTMLLLESAVVILATAFMTKNVARVNTMLFSIVLPIAFSLFFIVSHGNPFESMAPFLTYGIFGVVLLGLGAVLPGILGSRDMPNLTALYVFGGIYTALYIWTATHLYIEPYQAATVVSLFIYTIVGVTCYVKGILSKQSYLQHAGTIVLLLVIARLLIVDLGTMDVTGKVLTFGGIGILFIGASFISRKQTK